MNASGERTWEEAVSWLVSRPEQQGLVRDCYFDSPVEAAVERYRQSSEWAAIRQLLPSAAGVALDIGAGRGIVSYALSREGWQVTALEPDPSQLVGAGAIQYLADSQQLPITVIQEFGEHIPMPSASVDLVFARQALHHAKELQQLCAEATRLLKPGGVLVAVREHVISRREDLQAFFDLHPLHKLYGGENAYLLKEYLGAMKGAGLAVEQILSPLASDINLAPLDHESLRAALVERAAKYPGGRLAASVLTSSDWLFDSCLRVLEAFDRRPGRLYSFVCRKPALP